MSITTIVYNKNSDYKPAITPEFPIKCAYNKIKTKKKRFLFIHN